MYVHAYVCVYSEDQTHSFIHAKDTLYHQAVPSTWFYFYFYKNICKNLYTTFWAQLTFVPQQQPFLALIFVLLVFVFTIVFLDGGKHCALLIHLF